MVYCLGISLEYVSPTSQLQKWNKSGPPKVHESKSFDDFMGYKKTNNENSCAVEKDRLINLIINHRIPYDMTASRTANPYGYLNDHCYIKEPAYNTIKHLNHKTSKQILDIEKSTRKQSKSKIWKSIRKTRITASVSGEIIKAVIGNKRNLEKLCDKIINPKLLYVAAVLHGQKTEEKAFEAYKSISNLNILKCGIFIDNERDYLAATPDGICSNKSFIIEIKCPFKEINVEKLNYIKNKALNRKHNYFYQVQIQLHVTKIDKCIFIVYSDQIGFLHVETIFYDSEFTKECLTHIDNFYKNIFCPELIKNNWSLYYY